MSVFECRLSCIPSPKLLQQTRLLDILPCLQLSFNKWFFCEGVRRFSTVNFRTARRAQTRAVSIYKRKMTLSWMMSDRLNVKFAAFAWCTQLALDGHTLSCAKQPLYNGLSK